MSLAADSHRAREILQSLQAELQTGSGHGSADLSSLIYLLDSPLFCELLSLQDAVQQLRLVQAQQPSAHITGDDFEFDPGTGDLVLQPSYDAAAYDSAVAVTTGANSTESVSTAGAASATICPTLLAAVERAAQGRQVHVIALYRIDNAASLGFSVVGLQSEHRGELGIFVQNIQPGGIAARDGQLKENDQILAIDGNVLDSGVSHSQAIHILHAATSIVELVVARGAVRPSATAALTPPQPAAPGTAADSVSDPHDMVLSTELSQIEVIDLINDGSGLGFGIIGGKSTGVVVKTILLGGVADRDGRLQSGDHMLQIGDVNVRGMVSEQVACVLRQSPAHVRLIVARPVVDIGAVNTTESATGTTQIIPTSRIDGYLEWLNSHLGTLDHADMQHHDAQPPVQEADNYQYQPGLDCPAIVHQPPEDTADVKFFEVELVKDNQGLGITIAGYVGEKTSEELSGIFIRYIVEGSAAALDGRIQVNDQIMAVDSQPLHGFTNHEAVEVLRNTGHVVRLKLARYRNPKWDHMVEEPNGLEPTFTEEHHVDLDDIRLRSEDFSGEMSAEMKAALKAKWQLLVGDEYEIIVAQLSKFTEGGGLGISLEGTVDVVNGQEVRPHHYIRSVLTDGPVGMNGHMRSGDELLEVNNTKLLGLNHVEVVTILKELPQHVRIVCARRRATDAPPPYPQSTMPQQGYQLTDRLMKAKSEQALSMSGTSGGSTVADLNRGKSRSLEPLTGLAMWSSHPVQIELEKGARGLGFSILDYRDPLNDCETVIVIRSLVPGGVAQTDGRLVPGDRLVYVNDTSVENASLDEAVQALKGAPYGIVRIGVAKPLPLQDDIGESSTDDIITDSAPIADGHLISTTLTSHADLSPPHTPPPSPPSVPPPVDDIVLSYTKTTPLEDPRPNDCAVNAVSTETSNSHIRPTLAPKPRLSEAIQERLANGKRKESPSRIPLAITTTTTSVSKQAFLAKTESSPPPAASRPLNSSDLISSSSFSSGVSPPPSPQLGVASWGDSIPPLPSALERTIKIKKGSAQLGVTAETMDKGVNGCVVKAVSPSGAVARDGRIAIGDYLLAVNNETMRRVTNAQARAILRRASLLSTDISITYIPATDAEVHLQSAMIVMRSHEPPETATSHLSPNTTLSQPGNSQPSEQAAGSVPGGRSAVETTEVAPVVAAAGCVEGDVWSPPRLVKVVRQNKESLGISIVGGRTDYTHGDGTIPGIFIKHILESSPAGRCGLLNAGDRILQVDGEDLYDATHDRAVEVIRSATTPVTFVVQSLLNLDSLPNGEVDEDSEDSEEEDEYGYTWKKILKTYGELNGDLHFVSFERGSDGLGLRLAGNRNLGKMSVFVVGIQSSSPVALDGHIHIGDELLEINGHVLYGRSHLNASAIIKSVTAPVVKIILLRRTDYMDHMAVSPIRDDEVEYKDDPSTLLTSALLENHVITNTEETESSEHSVNNNDVKSETLSAASFAKRFENVHTIADANGRSFTIDCDNSKPGVFVKSLTGELLTSGQLSVGDRLLAVNDQSLETSTYDEAVQLLDSTAGHSIHLVVSKCPDTSPTAMDTTDHSKTYEVTAVSPKKTAEPIVQDDSQSTSEPDIQFEDPATCAIVPGREVSISIEKGKSGLGLSIVGGADTLVGAIIIHEVYEDGAAARDGRLWTGDQILEVNGDDLRHASHARAIQVLRQTTSVVHMVVLRDETALSDDDIYDVFSVELVKKPGRGLGLSIVGRRNDTGVFISDIVKGGVAEADGRLMAGDQILWVNDEDMRNASQEHAAAILKTLMGKVTLSVGRIKSGSRTSSRRDSSQSGQSDNHRSLSKSHSNASSKGKGKHFKGGSQGRCGSSGSSAGGIRSVLLQPDSHGSLGVSIAGGGSQLGEDTLIMVAAVQPGSPAAQSLQVGDVILSINEESTEHMTHEDAVSRLRHTDGAAVMLDVIQGEELILSSNKEGWLGGVPQPADSHEDTRKLLVVDLERGPDGLGFSIVGGHGSAHGDLPIYVKSVFERGAAAATNLHRGDQLLTVNGRPLDGLSHEQAVQLLLNTSGKVRLTALSS